MIALLDRRANPTARSSRAEANDTDDVNYLLTDISELEAAFRQDVLAGRTDLLLREGHSLKDEIMSALTVLAEAMGA